MNEKEYLEKEKEWCSMETRYHWIITTMLVIMSFMGGMVFQAERTSKQVATNTVKIEVLENRLGNIENKLDRLLEERRKNVVGGKLCQINQVEF